MWILFLFVAVPLVELTLLIEVGSEVGALPTIAICLVTASLGASLTRRQGLQVLARVRRSMAHRQLPADEMMSGALIVLAGFFLLTPGFATDALGFLLLIPMLRGMLGRAILHRVQTRTQFHGAYGASYDDPSSSQPGGDPDGPLFLPPGEGPQPDKKPPVIIVE